MNYLLAIALYLSPQPDHTADICLYMSSYNGNVTHFTIDTRDVKARLHFTRYGYALATDKEIYIGNRDDVIDQFRRDNCKGDFV